MAYPVDCESCLIRRRIAEILGTDHTPFAKLRAIELALHPSAEVRPVEREGRGWPKLSPSAWEIHDDPELS